MSPNRRTVRLNQLLREELARLLHTEIKDPRVAAVTVTRVDVTQDLSYADVYVRTLTNDVPLEDAIAGLESAEGFIRRRLGRDLHIRRIPDFRFHADRSLEHVQRIEDLLEEALGQREHDDEEN
ncbi:MAG: 30S ribosome-binding factor RbfA [Gemmatimonadetes bacterium]|jgi:ribosome-binding factor A|nr:30S ribosome-binding factor RbfA [Gemmatimonadota bacterium]